MSSFQEPSHKVIVVPFCGDHGHGVSGFFFPTCSRYTTIHRKQVAITHSLPLPGPFHMSHVFCLCPTQPVDLAAIVPLKMRKQTERAEDTCLYSQGRRGSAVSSPCSGFWD